jgi:protein involved in polysaccharide export with SLBB domain
MGCGAVVEAVFRLNRLARRIELERFQMVWMQRRFTALLASFLVFLVLSAASQQVAAQGTVVPTPEQLELFRNLTPEQQDAILKQVTGSGAGNLGGLSGLGGSLGTQSQDRQALQDRQASQTKSQTEEEKGSEEQLRIPVLKSDDWVVIEIDFHLPPRPAQLYLQSLYGQQGLSAQNLQALQSSGLAGTQQALAAGSGLGTTMPSAESSLSEQERGRLQYVIDTVRGKNPYQLSHDGVLDLPGYPGIALLGLTEEQATLRLKVEPSFKNLEVRVTRLPLKKTGLEALKPFGYDLFDRSPSTFAPVTNVPVPSDYIIGPGDQFDVQLYGTQNRTLHLTVGRDGRINFPELGPITVGGQLFSSVQSSLEARIARQMIGVRGSVSMGDTRSIRVFVLGEAKNPGSYTISGLGTITSALWAAGGVKTTGSLRHLQLKRQGSLIRELDLYDLLIRGDTTDDSKLLQGDVIFIPPIGATVAVDGEVRRPATYEIKREASVADVIGLAGGLTPVADTAHAMLTRIDAQQHRLVVPVDLSATGSKQQAVQNGDLIRLTRLRPTLDSGVVLEGHVFSPGAFAFHPGMHLTDVIHSVDELRPNADLRYLLIRRELPPDRHIAVLSADLAAALISPASKANVELAARDRILVFDLSVDRGRVLDPILDDLRLQGTSQHPTELVHVDGLVKAPGDYPLEPGMTVDDLIRAGGGLQDSAYASKAELTRYKVDAKEGRQTELVQVDLASAASGLSNSNIVLEPFDTLSIKKVPEWDQQDTVTLTGEVRFPGSYSIKRGETLKSVIARAGGLTTFAFPEGSAFTRVELKKREQEQLDILADRTQHDLIMLALSGAAAGAAGSNSGGGGAAALTVGQSLIGQLRASKAVGRLVIDLPRLLQEPLGSSDDVILRGHDELHVPKFQQQVTVIGEVQNATSHLYSPRLSRDDYISMSGGTTHRADRKRIYVVHANGSVVAHEGNRWFESADVQIRPGDTIVVPLDTERLPPLPFWQAVTGILYNVAIAVAAVHAL